MSDQEKQLDTIMDESIEEDYETMVFTDEEGNERTMEILAEICLDDDEQQYLIIAPIELEDDETEESVYVLKLVADESTDEDEVYEEVMDDEIAEKVVAKYESLCDAMDNE